MDALLDAVQAWIEGDPDPHTRRELVDLIEAADNEALSERFAGPLQFGTAGIRGEVGAGPSRVNRAVVIRTTSGLARFLLASRRRGPVVVGFDARLTSRAFAEDTIGVLLASGIDVKYFSDPIPTPVAAFACKELDAAAGVVVTASHNPPTDNGYKVYDSNGAQIIPPTDTEIASLVDATGPANEIPRVESALTADGAGEDVGDEMVERYLAGVLHLRPKPMTSAEPIVYTPIHGVGARVAAPLFERAGYSNLAVVAEQGEPDGTFPTVAFPNPEEPGALDLAVATASSHGAGLVLANDPDSDRLAVVTAVDGGFASLSGNEIGVLLGDYALRNWQAEERPIVVNSMVSSPMLGRIAEAAGAAFTTTLTGFKWIANAGLAMERTGEGRFAFGYEEALGYTVGGLVRDKDGISTAVIFADLCTELAESGRTPVDRLEELWSLHGMWASSQVSVAMSGVDRQSGMKRAVARVAADPPATVAGFDVVEVVDYRTGEETRPSWLGRQDLISLGFADGGRVLIRPSGTEPKLKIYIDLVRTDGAVARAEQTALTELASAVGRRVVNALGLGG